MADLTGLHALMPDIVITEFMDGPAVEALAAAHDTLYDPALVDDRPRLLSLLTGARALVVRNRTQVDTEILAAAPELVAVGRLGVGLDNIDLDACAARGVKVFPATGANTIAVAEYVIAAALQLVRPVYAATGEVVAGDWPRGRLQGGELWGRTLGLVGFGGIARAVATRARAFGMRVAAFDPHLPEGDLAWTGVARHGFRDLLAAADVVSLHVPLTSETRGLIGPDTLAAMKPGAILINTARGGVVDEPALAAALKSGQLGGAALDVFEAEPVSAAQGAVFEGVPHLILTPHIAGVTRESNTAVSHVTAQNVLGALA
jgi:(S)-sulfolactate dehydrogenase